MDYSPLSPRIFCSCATLCELFTVKARASAAKMVPLSHVRDTNYPCVCDEIVNLCDFWRTEKLRESGAEIKHIINEKLNSHYTRAYGYLHAAEQLGKRAAAHTIAARYLLLRKWRQPRGVSSLLCCKNKNTGSCGKIVIRPLEAFAAGGVVILDTFAKRDFKALYLRDEARNRIPFPARYNSTVRWPRRRDDRTVVRCLFRQA